jgi:UDP-2,4-diacetamido-2,4,6-trideoxy-beta-L-altropyranose hydrolase
MNKKKVILRADGGPETGMGHFTRTLALAEMLRNDFYTCFTTRSPSATQILEIEEICNEYQPLPKDDSHFPAFLDLLQGDEIVVLDNYYFDTDYQRAIRGKGCKLVCIDDLQDKHYVADVVINHAGGVNPENFSCEPYTQIFCGFGYALLRSPFLKTTVSPVEKDFDLLIGIGGADPLDISGRIVHELIKGNSLSEIAVLLGQAYQGSLTGNSAEQIRIFKNLGPGEVASLMRRSAVGIFPASTIAMEAIACRLPFFSFYFVENQNFFYHYLISNHLCISLTPEKFSYDYTFMSNFKFLLKTRNLFLRKAENEIDLNSPKRIIELFKKLNENI